MKRAIENEPEFPASRHPPHRKERRESQHRRSRHPVLASRFRRSAGICQILRPPGIWNVCMAGQSCLPVLRISATTRRRDLNTNAKDRIATVCGEDHSGRPHRCFSTSAPAPRPVARALRSHKDLLVVTNNINVATILASAAGATVIVTGGTLRPSDGGLVGPAGCGDDRAISLRHCSDWMFCARPRRRHPRFRRPGSRCQPEHSQTSTSNFSGRRRLQVPAYGPGTHCDTRGYRSVLHRYPVKPSTCQILRRLADRSSCRALSAISRSGIFQWPASRFRNSVFSTLP